MELLYTATLCKNTFRNSATEPNQLMATNEAGKEN